MNSIFVILLLTSISTKAESVESISWQDTTSEKKAMFVGDSEVLPVEFDAISIKRVKSSFDHTMSYAPKYLTFDYELQKCPKLKPFERELFSDVRNISSHIGKVKYIKVKNNCNLFVTIKSPYTDFKSFIYKQK